MPSKKEPELKPGAPVASQESSIRDAKDSEKPDPTTVAQIEEIHES
jgi:hypothetical protein